MSVKQVAVLFYGSFMRPEVMAQAGFVPQKIEVARLSGYDICLDPHANIFPHSTASIYGIVVYPTHTELERMYGASGVGSFLPEAVLVTTTEMRFLPVLCFMPPHRNHQAPDQAYLKRLIAAAQLQGLPSEYIARLEAFKGA